MVHSVAGLVARFRSGDPAVTAAMVVDPDGRLAASERLAPEVVRAAIAMVVPRRELVSVILTPARARGQFHMALVRRAIIAT